MTGGRVETEKAYGDTEASCAVRIYDQSVRGRHLMVDLRRSFQSAQFSVRLQFADKITKHQLHVPTVRNLSYIVVCQTSFIYVKNFLIAVRPYRSTAIKIVSARACDWVCPFSACLYVNT